MTNRKKANLAEFRARNRERLKMEAREYRKVNKAKIAIAKKATYEAKKEQILARLKEQRKANPQRGKDADARWRAKRNADPVRRAKANSVSAARQRRKRETSDLFRITCSIRSRIQAAVKKQYGKKAHKTIALIGCSVELLRVWIQSKWKEGMTWQNYGTRWHIDHVVPVVEFDLRKESHQRQCFHYSNMQPLWKRENLSKNASVPNGHQPELPLSLL